MSLIATTVRFVLCRSIIVRKVRRPIRPNPLITTLAVILPPVDSSEMDVASRLLYFAGISIFTSCTLLSGNMFCPVTGSRFSQDWETIEIKIPIHGKSLIVFAHKSLRTIWFLPGTALAVYLLGQQIFKQEKGGRQ